MATQPGKILVGALDRMVYSAANYWVVLLSDVVGALAFLMLGSIGSSAPASWPAPP